MLAKGCGDCEDQAIVIIRMLADSGLPYKNLGVCIVSGHAFAIVHHKEDDFYILDNGYMTKEVVEASLFFPFEARNGKALSPIAGFNVMNDWRY